MGKSNQKTAFYFYMIDRQKEFLAQGRHIGLRTIGADPVIHTDFKNLDPAERGKYDEKLQLYKAERQLNLTPEQLAQQQMQIVQKRVKPKANISNAYTIFGENYKILQSHQKNSKEDEEKFMEELLEELTKNDEELDGRNFVTMTSVHSFETSEHEFYPVELTMVGFNLEYGIKRDYWTLVDAQRIPVGYLNAAKIVNEETFLPIPGHRDFNSEHRDYLKMIKNMKRYVETFLNPYKGYSVIFTMPDEMKSVKGCIEWLIKNAEYDNSQQQYEFKSFFLSLKFLKLTTLLIKLAGIALTRTPEYDSLIARFNFMENAAEEILNKGDLDYELRITCPFHAQKDESMKMETCCRNIARRRVYFLLQELIPAMNIEEKEGHIPYNSLPPTRYVKESLVNSESEHINKRPRLSFNSNGVKDSTEPQPCNEVNQETEHNSISGDNSNAAIWD